ncbi:MAG: hypothetical protein JXR48_02060 [Candidatus Delongbacteria bacterium]|nr:hypothetical protein [Candidatus Delongbacteria bacterium]MBN2833730.1 hypothetical protein [Candidatus Delongbacteria bacterium]
MSEFTRSSKDNFIEIYKGFHKSKYSKDFNYSKVTNSKIELISDRKGVVGVKFNDYYEEIELASYYAENDFKTILDNQKLSSIYIGTSMEISEKDSHFKMDIGKTRPDFVVNHPDIGQILIDVKCRKSFVYEELRYFTITKEEVTDLVKIQTDIGLPIWLAFKDFRGFDFEKKRYIELDFYLIPVRKLQVYIEEINRTGARYSKYYYTYKIPETILSKNLRLGNIDFDTEFPKDMIKKTVEVQNNVLKLIRKTIIEVVQKEQVYKTYLPYHLTGDSIANSEFAGSLSDLTPQDINNILWMMIEKNEVIFEKEQYLKIGELQKKDKK